MRADLLVTGARGFVGRHLAAAARARGLVIVELVGDARDPAVVGEVVAAHRPRAIVHLAERKAADCDVLKATADNLRMAGNVVAAAAANSADTVVLIPGSAAEYGLGRTAPLDETAPLEPVSAYGAAKCVLERAFTSPLLVGGVRMIWARSFNHLGPGQPETAPVASWARQAALAERAGGGPVGVGNLDPVRDFLDVRDVAEIYLDLVASDAAGVVNVCSGEATPLREVADAVVASFAPTVFLERRADLVRTIDPPCVVGDPARLHECIGRRPLRAWRETVLEVAYEWRAATGAKELTLS